MAEVARLDQEVWGLALAYNLFRLHMVEQAAQVIRVAPSRIRYLHALLLLRNSRLSA